MTDASAPVPSPQVTTRQILVRAVATATILAERQREVAIAIERQIGVQEALASVVLPAGLTIQSAIDSNYEGLRVEVESVIAQLRRPQATPGA